ncbi:MAG: CBS domain-containing protein [Flavobacteriales bacterium]|nr:CBS domain-containing protein [Flavobacteriales bacterium]
MKKREPVSHIMTKEVKTININDGTLVEAKDLMEKNKIRHVPVVSGEKLVGMLSLTDIHRISFGGNFDQEKEVDAAIFDMLSVSQVMKSDLRTVKANDTIKEVAEQLAVEEFHALPVTNENGSLEGIVTTTDLVNYLIDQY